MGANNKNLRKAQRLRNDEFYTQLVDIEKELIHYKDFFENKIIYCNCDNPSNSNFWNYFISNIKEFKIKGIISTYYSEDNISYKTELSNEDIVDSKNIKDYIKRTQLKNNGDFRNEENIKILKSADIIITNPPFSLFREYIAQLVEYKKNFIIVGNNNSIACKGIFNLIKDNTIWLGYNSNKEMEFEIPDHYEKWNRIDKSTGKKYGKVPACSWFTNLKTKKREEWLELVKTYEGNEDKYPKYDNYDAINVDRVKDIPFDYKGNIGVPITFMTKFNPQQFEIIDGIHRYSILTGPTDKTKGKYLSMINNKAKFARIIIKQRESI